MGINIEVRLSGPIVRGEAPAIIHRYKVHLEKVIGDRAVTMIRFYLPTQYMYLGNNGGNPKNNPVPPNAGELAASIHTERAIGDYELVVGDDVIYGPWIEGVAFGNTMTFPGRVKRGLSARFPGYHAFRKVSQVLDVVAGDIARTELPRYIEDLRL